MEIGLVNLYLYLSFKWRGGVTKRVLFRLEPLKDSRAVGLERWLIQKQKPLLIRGNTVLWYSGVEVLLAEPLRVFLNAQLVRETICQSL